MELSELLRVHGSVIDIPEAALRAAGYKRIRAELGFRLVRANHDVSEEIRGLAAKLAGTKLEQTPLLSRHYYLRLKKVVDYLRSRRSASSGKSRNFTILLQSFAKGAEEIERVRRELKPHQEIIEKLAKYQIKTDVWQFGIDEWRVDLKSAAVFTRTEFLERLQCELSEAFEIFTSREMRKPNGMLREISERVGASTPEVGAILEAVRGNETRLRTLIEVAARRAENGLALKDNRSTATIGYFHLLRLRSLLSRKGGSEARQFSFRLAEKNPWTILTIGNDAGCCIGVYLKDDEFGEGWNEIGSESLPGYLLDGGVQFLEIRRGEERCGMALLFAGIKKGAPVLVVNSIELHESAREIAGAVVDVAMDWLSAFARACGFTAIYMGTGLNNTAVNYSAELSLRAEITSIEQLLFYDEHYGDVLSAYTDGGELILHKAASGKYFSKVARVSIPV